jgi:hypothetical protein
MANAASMWAMLASRKHPRGIMQAEVSCLW